MGDVFNQGGFGGAPQKIWGVSWPNLVGAFKVVLPGNGLGKPDVFNQGGFINHVPPLFLGEPFEWQIKNGLLLGHPLGK